MSLPWPGIAAGLGLLIVALIWVLVRTRRRLAEERSKRRSQSVRHGQTTEQFAPLLDAYPHDPEDFRFLGSPIDGIQFDDDAIRFVEIKTGRSGLTKRQRRVRDLVEAGEVEWVEIRLGE